MAAACAPWAKPASAQTAGGSLSASATASAVAAATPVLKGDAYVRIAVGIANNLGPERTLAADALPRM
jgi:hypothetical protein